MLCKLRQVKLVSCYTFVGITIVLEEKKQKSKLTWQLFYSKFLMPHSISNKKRKLELVWIRRPDWRSENFAAWLLEKQQQVSSSRSSWKGKKIKFQSTAPFFRILCIQSSRISVRTKSGSISLSTTDKNFKFERKVGPFRDKVSLYLCQVSKCQSF